MTPSADPADPQSARLQFFIRLRRVFMVVLIVSLVALVLVVVLVPHPGRAISALIYTALALSLLAFLEVVGLAIWERRKLGAADGAADDGAAGEDRQAP